MPDLQDHTIQLHFDDGQAITLGGVIEATGLIVNAFVEGQVLRDRTYEYSIQCVSSRDFVIRAKLRHPLEEGLFAQERAFAPLYLVYVAWFLAGANVDVEGTWKVSFPGGGALKHETNVPIGLRPLFQDELPSSERAAFPSLETLAEVHDILTQDAAWDQVLANPAFRSCFPSIAPNHTDKNNIRLRHNSGLNVDLVLKKGLISFHILASVQAEYDLRFISCRLDAVVARTWWDAWIGHCPSTSIQPKQLLVLPNEVALLSMSGSIWRYQLEDPESIERHHEIFFGNGVNPTRSIESWVRLATQFGEAGFVEIAIACCEQAMLSAKALIAQAPGLSIQLPIGVSARQQLNESETEYCRWLDHRETLEKPPALHDRWNEKVTCRGVHELAVEIGSKWQPALDELIEAIDNQHFDSHDYHRKIGHVREFFWNVDGQIGTLKYRRLFGRELIDAKVPKKAISLLGYSFRDEGIPSYVDFDDIFTLALGNAEFWGSVEERVLVSCSEPHRAYRL